VRFNHALASLRYKRLRKEQRRKEVFVDVAQMKDEDGKPLDDENTLARISAAARSAATQESFTHLGEMMEAINALPAPEREAVILVCIKGFKVESEDPHEETAATLCKVSGRAIRKRLQKAAEKLKKFKQEE
jgi:DNA-directed RNA polymerase specialized sigma24 family protein